jgi:DNA repair exonuclease SbcCD nuclease subunit/S-adenosylmethionine/arginine decarboxylase-like enzyme
MRLKRIYHIADIHIRNIKRHKEFREVFYSMFEEIQKRGTEDSIIYLAGDIAHAKLEMSPELVSEISWLFTECNKLCPTIVIAGNHDCNMNNSDRMDVLTPIVDALKLPNLTYLKDTQVYGIGDVDFAVFSIFDNKDNWPKANTLFGNKKIALFHGPVDNSTTDVGYVVSSRHFTTEIFDGYDLALLGDIHKRQEMISPSGCKVVYAGSLVQQNFGETLDKHGFLVWDLDTMTYEEVDIQNDYGYYTLDIDGGIVPDVTDMPLYPRLRVRVTNTDTADTKRMMADITAKYGVEDFTIIRTDTFNKKKTNDREARLEVDSVADINHQNSLIGEYVERMMPFVTKEDLAGIENINRDINSRVQPSELQRNISWKPIRFDFSNMFSYGERNVINFDKVNGLMGLFAPNAQGKSSLFDAISFCLFDKCSRAYKAAAIMNNRKQDFHCQLEFSVDGVVYGIRREGRTINKGKNVKVDVDFWKEGDTGRESLNGTERRDTNQIIEGYVGRYEDFIMTALSLQSNNALFIDKSQSERKDLMAQFMGLDIFDKLYDTATNDIKDVNALIRNFRKTDFTSELAQKENDLNEKKIEYGELDSEKLDLETRKADLEEQIVGLSQQIVPIQGNLDIDELNRKLKKINDDLTTWGDTKFDKTIKLTEAKELVREAKEMVDSKVTINGIGIEIVYSNYQREQKALIEAEKIYSTVKSQLTSAEEKINHLDKHEYDPNCKFCCDNEFVKDAMRAKEALPELQRFVQNATIQCTGIQQTLDSWEGVEEQFKEWKEWTDEHKRLVIVKERLEGDIRTADSKIELLQTQKETVQADIQRYNDNEETITKNQALDIQIQNVRRLKQGVEKQISDVNKLMLKLMSEVGATKTYIDNMVAKMEEVKELESKNQLYTFYLDAVKKDGVPYELISKALPAIENEVNNILGQVVDFSISMDTDGKNINARIVYEDQEWALEMCSGMEKFISGLAIRVALINICNLPRPNFLVIDEGFGTLDADNLSSLFMMMQYLKTQFDFIWVISHLEQMRDIVDGLIEIKKIDGFSKINF